eukprot:scaffold3980_cov348-Prasinococcus_capsulatus_cf.AAC.6
MRRQPRERPAQAPPPPPPPLLPLPVVVAVVGSGGLGGRRPPAGAFGPAVRGFVLRSPSAPAAPSVRACVRACVRGGGGRRRRRRRRPPRGRLAESVDGGAAAPARRARAGAAGEPSRAIDHRHDHHYHHRHNDDHHHDDGSPRGTRKGIQGYQSLRPRRWGRPDPWYPVITDARIRPNPHPKTSAEGRTPLIQFPANPADPRPYH